MIHALLRSPLLLSLGLGCLGYFLNALWQLPLLFLAAKLLLRLGRGAGPAFAHRVWVANLLLGIALPAVPQRVFGHFKHSSLNTWLNFWQSSLVQRLWLLLGHPGAAPAGIVQITFSDTVVAGLPSSLDLWSWALLPLALAATAFCTARLLWHLRHIAILRRQAGSRQIPTDLAGRFDRHRRHANAPHAELALTSGVRGPATIGILRPLVLLPSGFPSLTSPEDQDAALAHECAHVQRHDFAKNLAYEILSLPLAFHPLRRLTLAQVAASREILCDNLAARALDGPDRYARSLLRLAAAMLSATPAANPHAIGLCDAHTLERRIMNLTRKSSTPSTAHSIFLVAATLVLTLATCTSALALHLGVVPSASQTVPDAKTVKGVGTAEDVKILSQVDPVYPPKARAAHISGAVVLKVHIDKVGAVQAVYPVSGPLELQQSAITAVRQWKFQPALIAGSPAEAEIYVNINYQSFK